RNDSYLSSRYSYFFRQHSQLPYFYRQLKILLKSMKESKKGSSLIIDLVGLGLFQEPLTILATIRSAYESEGVGLKEVPLEINCFDKDTLISQLYQNDGLVYDKKFLDLN